MLRALGRPDPALPPGPATSPRRLPPALTLLPAVPRPADGLGVLGLAGEPQATRPCQTQGYSAPLPSPRHVREGDHTPSTSSGQGRIQLPAAVGGGRSQGPSGEGTTGLARAQTCHAGRRRPPFHLNGHSVNPRGDTRCGSRGRSAQRAAQRGRRPLSARGSATRLLWTSTGTHAASPAGPGVAGSVLGKAPSAAGSVQPLLPGGSSGGLPKGSVLTTRATVRGPTLPGVRPALRGPQAMAWQLPPVPVLQSSRSNQTPRSAAPSLLGQGDPTSPGTPHSPSPDPPRPPRRAPPSLPEVAARPAQTAAAVPCPYARHPQGGPSESGVQPQHTDT